MITESFGVVVSLTLFVVSTPNTMVGFERNDDSSDPICLSPRSPSTPHASPAPAPAVEGGTIWDFFAQVPHYGDTYSDVVRNTTQRGELQVFGPEGVPAPCVDTGVCGAMFAAVVAAGRDGFTVTWDDPVGNRRLLASVRSIDPRSVDVHLDVFAAVFHPEYTVLGRLQASYPITFRMEGPVVVLRFDHLVEE